MEKLNLKFMAAVVTLFSIMTATIANAAPVRFNQVTQVVNVKPGKANNGNFSRLQLTGDDTVTGDTDGDNDGEKKKTAAPPAPQDDRVITETSIEVVEDEVCDCVEDAVVKKGGFPKWALLGLGAIPLIFLIKKGGDDPTPTPTTPTTPTPTTPTPTTPTPTPTTPTPTTPTPEEPVPEPMTILLFGTGLAGIGLAARRKLGRKKDGDEDETEE